MSKGFQNFYCCIRRKITKNITSWYFVEGNKIRNNSVEQKITNAVYTNLLFVKFVFMNVINHGVWNQVLDTLVSIQSRPEKEELIVEMTPYLFT